MSEITLPRALQEMLNDAHHELERAENVLRDVMDKVEQYQSVPPIEIRGIRKWDDLLITPEFHEELRRRGWSERRLEDWAIGDWLYVDDAPDANFDLLFVHNSHSTMTGASWEHVIGMRQAYLKAASE